MVTIYLTHIAYSSGSAPSRLNSCLRQDPQTGALFGNGNGKILSFVVKIWHSLQNLWLCAERNSLQNLQVYPYRAPFGSHKCSHSKQTASIILISFQVRQVYKCPIYYHRNLTSIYLLSAL